jgi:hypothetical protein
MSAQLPPDVIIFPGIDYNSSFYTSKSDTLTYEEASKNFLKYPNAQGTENLQTINVTGPSTFSSPSIMNISNANNTALTISKTSGYTNSGLIMNNAGIQQNGSNYLNTLGQINLNSNSDLNIAGGNIYQYQPFSSNYIRQYLTSGALKWDSNVSGSNQNVLTLNNSGLSFVPPLTNTATQPSSTDSSTRIPTTSWVQSAVGSSFNYPQKWFSSSCKFNGQTTTIPKGGQTLKVQFPISNDQALQQCYVVNTTLEISYQILASSATNAFDASPIYQGLCIVNLYYSPYGTYIGGLPSVSDLGYSVISNIGNVFGSQTLSINGVNASSWVPVSMSSSNANGTGNYIGAIGIYFNPIPTTGNVNFDNCITLITRSVRIVDSITTPENIGSFNVSTYPNQNYTSSTNGLPAYLIPVNT